MLPAIFGGFAGVPFQQELRCRVETVPGRREVGKNKTQDLFFLLSGVLAYSLRLLVFYVQQSLWNM
ncbi:MAG: hypothetical protein DI538_22980 [Azospira oryzae]|nr:MAG: hypothetical protein DI538_22980 [Azospira oryzae]